METPVIYYRNTERVVGSNVSEIKDFLIPNCVGYLEWNSKNTAISPVSRHDYYLVYVVRGGMEILSVEPTESIEAGQFVCFYPETVYRYKTLDDGVKYYLMHFTGHAAAELLEKCGIKNSHVYSVGILENVLSEWHELCQDFSRQDYLFAMRSSSKMLKIFSVFAEKIDRSGEVFNSKRLRKSIDYIYENFNRDISIPELARLEHLSVSRYYTLFKEITGYSPSEYVIVLKMNRACTFLQQTDMTVKEIAQQVGYHDPFYFSRLFKKYMKTSPVEYKKQKN